MQTIFTLPIELQFKEVNFLSQATLMPLSSLIQLNSIVSSLLPLTLQIPSQLVSHNWSLHLCISFRVSPRIDLFLWSLPHLHSNGVPHESIPWSLSKLPLLPSIPLSNNKYNSMHPSILSSYGFLLFFIFLHGMSSIPWQIIVLHISRIQMPTLFSTPTI